MDTILNPWSPGEIRNKKHQTFTYSMNISGVTETKILNEKNCTLKKFN